MRNRFGRFGNAFIGIMIIVVAFIFAACNKPSFVILSGFLEAEDYNVVAEAQGRVTEILKKQGDLVKKGELFAKIDSGTHDFTIKQLQEMVNIKTIKLSEITKGARPEELLQAQARVMQAESALISSQKALETSKVNYDYLLDKYNKIQDQYKDITISTEEIKDSRFKLETANKSLEEGKERVNAAKAQLDGANAAYEMIRNGATLDTINLAQAELKQAQIQLLSAKSVLEKYAVKAPADGIVVSINSNVGEVLNPGSNIGEISDRKDMHVKFYIPQKYLTKIMIGSEMTLNSYSDKNLKINGVVSYISDTAEFTPKNIETNEAKETTVYMVKLKIVGETPEVKPGMTLEWGLK